MQNSNSNIGVKNLDEVDIMKWDEKDCLTFLRENFGLRGYNGGGITRNLKDRTLHKMRLECAVQNTINNINKLKYQHK